MGIFDIMFLVGMIIVGIVLASQIKKELKEWKTTK